MTGQLRITKPLFTPGTYANLNVGDVVEILATRNSDVDFTYVVKGGVLMESEVEHV